MPSGSSTSRRAFLLFCLSFALLSVSAVYKKEGTYLRKKERIGTSFRSLCYLNTVYFLKEDKPLADYDGFSARFGKEVAAESGTYEVVSVRLDPSYVYPRYFSAIEVEVTLSEKKSRPFILSMEFKKGGNRL